MTEINQHYRSFIFAAILLFSIQGTTGFFLKHTVTGKCIYNTNITKSVNETRYFKYVELADECFASASQFKYRDNGAIFSLNVPGCLEGFGDDPEIIYINAESDKNSTRHDCRNVTAVDQTLWGGLRFRRSLSKSNRCAVTYKSENNQKIGAELKITNCNDDVNKRFIFGSATCLENNITNAGCGKSQYMVIKYAEYRSLKNNNTCGSSYDYSCSFNVTCHLKRQCDGKRECNIIVDDNLFPSIICFGSHKYLYFEYQCKDNMTSFNETCFNMLSNRPIGLRVHSIASRYVKISWMYQQNITVNPNTSAINSLTELMFILKRQMVVSNKTVLANVSRPYMLSGLSPDTTYTVVVIAGKSFSNIFFKTNEDVPGGPPLNVSVAVINSSSISLSWEPPDVNKRNGKIVSYTVCLAQWQNVTWLRNFTTESQSLNITKLKPLTKYYARVSARTKAGNGNYSESQVAITNELQPSVVANSTDKTLTYSLRIPKETYQYFFVIAMEGDKPNPPPPSQLKIKDLGGYSPLKPYIAAVIKLKDEDLFMFTLGDGSNSSITGQRTRRSTERNYYNHPLKADTNYRVFQRVVLNDTGSYSTDWSPVAKTGPAKTATSPTQTLPSPQTTPKTPSLQTLSPHSPQTAALQPTPQIPPPQISPHSFSTSTLTPMLTPFSTSTSFFTPGVGKDDDQNMLIIISAGGGGGVVFIVVLVVVVICLKRRRAVRKKTKLYLQSEEQEEKTLDFSVSNPAFITDNVDGPVETSIEDNKNISESIPEDDTYTNNESIVVRNHFPVPLEKFNEHVIKLRQKNMQELKLEFEDLPNNQKCDWAVSKSALNSSKNRYGNAVTYDHSRVILSGDETTDYINASFIDGKSEKYYIATQGPKPTTIDDFWRMIFEHKCSTIVMLTTLKEMGRVKCEKYWPDESKAYGEIKVTVTKSKIFADYVTRFMVVEKDGEQLKVEQFHYKSWPDYGVPRYPTQLLTFTKHFKLSHKTRSGPAVVHCSAGVGRTGVFIAIDKIMDDLDDNHETSVDVFGFVKEMRLRRINMVQTADQYMFIHDAIIDHIKFGANEVEASKIKVEILHLSKKNENGKTEFEAKFKRLQSVTPELPEELCEAALSDENKKKNRNPKIHPTESNRPALRRIENKDSSDYINACFVDGHLGKNYFIATQTPLKETINDFWRMVTQHECTTIVLLNQLTEDDEEYPMFWPTKRATSLPYGTCAVLFDSVVKKDDIVIRKFIASPSMDVREGRMVRMIQYLSWPNHGVPKDVHSLVHVLKEVEEAQRAVEEKGPVVVVCSDGAGRSGTYITISNLVDRVKIVQVVDVFQCIKLIRIGRPQFVETAEQFKFCYDAVACVLESFEGYSNFADLGTT